MRTIRCLAVLLPFLLAMPPVGADAPVSMSGWGTCEDEHGAPQVPCWLFVETTFALGACDAASCAYRVEAGAHLAAHVPNLLYVFTDVYSGAGSACFGPPQAWQQGGALNAACGRVCESARFGWTLGCEGNTTAWNPGIRTLNLPVGGCDRVVVVSYATWGYAAQNAYVMLAYDVCRTAEDAFAVVPSLVAASPDA